MNLFTSTMRPLIFALLSLFTVCLVAQSTYRPTAEEGANWIVVDSETHHYPYSTFVRSIQGDTILDGITYRKLYQRVIDFLEVQDGPELAPPYELLPGKELIALLRDDVDARKVYGRTTDFNIENSEMSVDTLFHDFSVEAGNFATGYFFVFDSVEVQETGQAFYYDEMRRYQVISFVRFYEGVGSAMGPTSGNSFIHLNCCDWRLVDYCLGDFTDCNIISSVVTLPGNVEVSVLPNPFTDFIHLELPNGAPANHIDATLRDLNGRVFRTAKLTANLNWSVADIPAGVYLVTLSEGRASRTLKMIKR